MDLFCYIWHTVVTTLTKYIIIIVYIWHTTVLIQYIIAIDYIWQYHLNIDRTFQFNLLCLYSNWSLHTRSNWFGNKWYMLAPIHFRWAPIKNSHKEAYIINEFRIIVCRFLAGGVLHLRLCLWKFPLSQTWVFPFICILIWVLGFSQSFAS